MKKLHPNTITKREYKDALEIVREFEKCQKPRSVIKKTCICCKISEVTPLFPLSVNVLKQEDGSWLNGTVGKLLVGYGSEHDTKEWYFAICDKCLTSLEKSAILERI